MRKSNCDKQNGMPGIVFTCKETKLRFDGCNKNPRYSTAYARMLLLVKSGVIGKVVSIDAVCTSLKKYKTDDRLFRSKNWNSIYAWGPTGLLPVLQLLGEEYKRLEIMSLFA